MANFTRQDVAGRCRFIIDIGPTGADLDVQAIIPLDDGDRKVVEILRAEIVAGTTGPERSNTRSLLDKMRTLAVTKAGGV